MMITEIGPVIPLSNRAKASLNSVVVHECSIHQQRQHQRWFLTSDLFWNTGHDPQTDQYRLYLQPLTKKVIVPSDCEQLPINTHRMPNTWQRNSLVDPPCSRKSWEKVWQMRLKEVVAREGDEVLNVEWAEQSNKGLGFGQSPVYLGNRQC